jgi:hypothetical protein
VLSSAGGPEGPGRRDLKVAAYLTKPIDGKELRQAIQALFPPPGLAELLRRADPSYPG